MNELEELIALLGQDADENIQADAAEMLGEIGGVRAVKALLAALNDPSGVVCVSVILSLGELRAAEALEPLLVVLSDGAENERGAAAVALGRSGTGGPSRR